MAGQQDDPRDEQRVARQAHGIGHLSMREDMMRRGEIGRRVGVNLGPRVVDLERSITSCC